MDQSPLAAEIGKREPFEHAEQEAFLNLMRTVSILEADFKSLFRKHGLSSTTYNMLRILRGHKPHGLRCTQIKCELVSRVPDITRLVDRLEESGLVRRAADPKDARAVVIHITPKGYRVLEKLDEPVTNLHRRQLGHLAPQELAALNDLLAKARHPT